jgi:CRISPR-associated protein Cmr6
MPIYNLEHGILDILAMGKIKDKRKGNLEKFLKKLLQFSLLLGGFGKSWRRIDHRLFFNDYLEDGDKPMIGCHWEFIRVRLFSRYERLSS